MAWDNRGHSTIAYIAERHLTPRAKANIESYIGGRSIVYYAAWMDFNRSTPPFDVTRDWHVDYWTDAHRTDENGNPQPPCSVSQIKRIVSEMGDFRTLSDSLVNVNIKFLVHLVGDMHCPVHTKYSVNEPNLKQRSVKMKGKKMGFHAFWDASVGYYNKGLKCDQIAEKYDTLCDAEIAAICEGNANDWAAVNAVEMREIYTLLPMHSEVTEVSEQNHARMKEITMQQALRGGYRLAKVLNEIFSK